MTTQNTEMQQILLIARSIAGVTGHDLLSGLVSALSRYLDAAFVAITFGEGHPPTHARTLFALEENNVSEDLRYELSGTPCARVYAGETVIIPCKIAALYPEDAEYEGYIGIPLRDVSGDVAGHLAIFTTDHIRDSEVAAAIAQIFALRAEAELRRIAEEANRQSLISDLSALNTRLQRGYAKLRHEIQQKTNLMGLVSHDLRSPLSVIMAQAELGCARLGAVTPDTEKLDSGFRKIMNSADRMTGLISAALEHVRADSEALQISAQPCDLANLISIAVEANSEEAARKSISLHVDPAPGVTATVDDALIVSAIDNLINNALKYTHSGGSVHVDLPRSRTRPRSASRIPARASPKAICNVPSAAFNVCPPPRPEARHRPVWGWPMCARSPRPIQARPAPKATARARAPGSASHCRCRRMFPGMCRVEVGVQYAVGQTNRNCPKRAVHDPHLLPPARRDRPPDRAHAA